MVVLSQRTTTTPCTYRRSGTLSHDELAGLIAKRFIQRKDVKAIQVADGGYRPVREPWKMGDLRAHITGEQTFGHYTCDTESKTKLIVFDCDLDDTGTWVDVPSDDALADITSDSEFMDALTIYPATPRKDWHDRKHPGRTWYKKQMRTIADTIASSVVNHLGLEAASAYSGNKGVHIYAFFPEPVEARVARQAALMALEHAGRIISPNYGFEAVKGSNFFKHMEPHPYFGIQNFTVEIFPKQSSMEGKDLGNLVRLPGGVNNKNPKDPCFFLDQRVAQAEFKPHPDPVHLLKTGNPFA